MIGADLCQCALIATLQSCSTGRPDCQHHDVRSHSVTLSRYWTNPSFPYLNNAEHLARKWPVSILKPFGLNWPGLEPTRFRFPNLLKPETLYSFGHSIWSCIIDEQNQTWSFKKTTQKWFCSVVHQMLDLLSPFKKRHHYGCTHSNHIHCTPSAYMCTMLTYQGPL